MMVLKKSITKWVKLLLADFKGLSDALFPSERDLNNFKVTKKFRSSTCNLRHHKMSAFEFSLYIIERFDPEVKDTISISILHFLYSFVANFKEVLK